MTSPACGSPASPMRAGGHGAFLLLVVLLLSACAGPERRQLPLGRVEAARPRGFDHDVRAAAGEVHPSFQAGLEAAFGPPVRQRDVLVLSGGGADGAFCVGVLRAWTEQGDRPAFDLVTGISTGALVAPFVFAGPHRDELLRREYTSIKTEDIVTEKSLFSLLNDDSVNSSDPLRRKLERLVDAELLAEIAARHRAGARLWIGTANLDRNRLIVWDMGAIAARGGEASARLFREVMLASASVPVYMPPVYLEVEADGGVYDEMHVDGGTIASSFLHASVVDFGRLRRTLGSETVGRPRVWVIRNSKVRLAWKPIEPRLFDIASRAVETMLTSSAVGDVYRIFSICRRDGLDFRLAVVPDDFIHETDEFFDPGDMQRLHDLGYEMVRKGRAWRLSPPGWSPFSG